MIEIMRIVDVKVTLPPRPEFKSLEWKQTKSCVFEARDEYSTFKLRYLGARWRLSISGYRTSSWYPTLWYAKWGIDQLRKENFEVPYFIQSMQFKLPEVTLR